MKKLNLIILLLFAFTAFGKQKDTQVDTITVYSESMKKDIKNVVILPEQYNKKGDDEAYPVLYLLHGASGAYSNWIKKAKNLPKYASEYKMIIVCPDGSPNGWYLDSPLDSTNRYETYITKELVSAIDGAYRSITERKGRAITGLSMGGHGALWLAFRHQNLYCGAGSMSGAVDISAIPSASSSNKILAKLLGPMESNLALWESHSVMGSLHLLKPRGLQLIIDCGVGDFLYPMNIKLHEELLYKNIPHDFISRPGKHSWDYWKNAIKYQIIFFSLVFDSQEK